MRSDTVDYRTLFLQGVPLLDTRAPVEFARGAFPQAVNLPLMTDSEREKVGACYKHRGREAAVSLGHDLVTGGVKQARVEAWCEFARNNPQGYLYCFRGGMRSEISQRWMHDRGVDYPRVLGGYKAMRRFLVDELQAMIERGEFVLIGGRTGAGKTRVVNQVQRSVDLEGLANHRGSSFGRLPGGQPAQIDFENALAVELMRLLEQRNAPVVLEDEGRLVGRISLPAALAARMRESPLMVVEAGLESRVDIIYQDYVVDLAARYRGISEEQGETLHRLHLTASLDRIRKRLGGEMHRKITNLMDRGFLANEATAPALHHDWIRALLVHYYDPMYDYLVSRRPGPVIARGERDSILDAAASLAVSL